MRRLLSEPLVHFLLGGALLTGLVSFVRGDRAPSEVSSASPIRVEAGALEQFVQAKTGIQDSAEFEASYASLDESARREWIDRFVREEALVREARKLGLDQNDDLIRRRLVQQIEFVALGAVESNLVFGSAELEESYRARREDYRIPASLTFSHVFVRAAEADGGDAGPRERARSILQRLNEEKVDVQSAMGLGDRFLYNRNYVNRTREEVVSHFGEAMAETLSSFEPDADSWRGPLRSVHGFHLVLLMSNEASRLPEPGEIRDQLREDWKREARAKALDQAVSKIVEGYRVEVSDELGPFDERPRPAAKGSQRSAR